MTTSSAETTSVVNVTHHGGCIVVAVHGELDGEVAQVVRDAVESALAMGTAHDVEVDLRAMQRWTAGGLRAVMDCARFGTRFRMGPQVATAP